MYVVRVQSKAIVQMYIEYILLFVPYPSLAPPQHTHRFGQS